MERQILQQLINWKNSSNRKPLILLGARQIGKTYILKQFGATCYENVAYINCDNNPQVANLFADGYDMKRILLSISAICNVTVKPEKTLIIFDEIQELKLGLHALKYFYENIPEYHIVVAGSLLGIAIRRGESFPVGKVNILNMYPMTFGEFLIANDKRKLYDILISKDWATIKLLRNEFIKLLREYYFVGGMPEVVKTYIETNDAVSVREVQNEILFAYKRDVSKHAPKNEVERISQVWQSIPSQLAKENKKFIYGVLKHGARAKEYEIAIQWLIDAGLVYKISRVNSVKLPLKLYEDLSAFKLFVLDCGLLGAMCGIMSYNILTGEFMSEYKGIFTENFVATQLLSIKDLSLFYYSRENATLELDFIAQYNGVIKPIEVKAEDNVKSKSMRTFITSHPEFTAFRFSMNDYIVQDYMTNVPLYACREMF